MKAIILAAGYATRLYPLTENYPKPLLKVRDKTILNWLIDDLNEEISQFYLLSNHKFINHFKKWAEEDPKITVIDDLTCDNEHRLGALKDIRLAAEQIDEDTLVLAGDNVLDFSLKKFIAYAKEKDSSCVMCHEEDRLKALQKTAVITIGENGLITSYEEKPKEPKGHLAVPPFYFYKLQDLQRIDEALAEGCSYDAPGSFAAWLSEKTAMHAYLMPGRRYDIGDLESYEYVQKTYQGFQ